MAIPAAAIPYLISGAQTVIGGAQTVASRRRRRQALESLRKEIPSALLENTQLARERASRTGLPGEDVTRSRIESQAAGTMERGESVAETAADILGLYGKVFAQQADTERQMLEAGAQYKDQNERDLMRSLGLLSEAQGQQFYYNEFVPFLSEMGYAGDQAQGGAANIAAGLQGAYGAWNDQWMMNEMQNMYGTEPMADSPAPNNFVSSYYNNRLNRDLWAETTPPNQYANPVAENQMGVEPWMTDNNVWNTGSGQGNQPWQNLPEWQKKNPVSYPASWLKYR